ERQMCFVAGPRQVGKTTSCRRLATTYLDWDVQEHRALIAAGQHAVAERAGLELLQADDEAPVLVLDELHKYPRWKNFLKGFFDLHGERCHIVVTGSSRLDAYRRGGDSLMGRYFLYRMHPLSVAELLNTQPPGEELVRPPTRPDESSWQALWEHGGYPEPLARNSARFSRRWRTLRRSQLLNEDLRDLTRVQEVALVEILGQLLADRSGEQLVYSNLAADVQAAPNSIKAWIETLCALHFGFVVRPWYRNVSRALRKEPKWYLRDWSGVADEGSRAETFIANHLLKAVEGWTDWGLGAFELRYVRDRNKREVDFLVVRDAEPWFLVEVKKSGTAPSPGLAYFQQQTRAAHAFQVVLDQPYVEADCFAHTAPTVVPARTFLSQLL
ncbi:MAG: ATP-binding protein, partial [Myxococcota bacterium]|nr:ATP-binding protein [Myxococcota bacterium]